MRTARLCDVAVINPTSLVFDAAGPDDEVLFVPMEGVWSDGLAFETRRRSEVETGFTRFEDGDLLVPKITPTFGHGRSVVVAGLDGRPGAGTTELHVLRPRGGVDARWLSFVTKSADFIAEGESTLYGVAGQKRIDTRWLRSFRVPELSLNEQRQIADFLDAETARIDRLVAKQEALIETLRERRAAVIDRAFERDLDTSRRTRMERACIDVVDCPHTTPEEVGDSRFEAVRTTCVRAGTYRPEFSIAVSEETWRDRNRGGVPTSGDVLLTREAPAGEACLVPPDRSVCLGQRMVLLRVDAGRSFGQFLMWQVYSKSVQDYFRLFTHGSTVGNLRLGLIRKTPITLPSLDEQREIVAYLDSQTSKIDTLIGKAERFIELAKERRAALITAAVTGQIDVRSHAA